MVGVTTIALLERKPTISRDLFSRYWRDVHGVMAARIPGFHSYVQHHVTPFDDALDPFEGIAVVGFADERDRNGLVTSEMTRHIHRDEQNVFRRALLYNLAQDAVQIERNGAAEYQCFAVIPEGLDETMLASRLRDTAVSALRRYDLKTGDPAAWNNTDVSAAAGGRRYSALVQAAWTTVDDRDRAAAVLSTTGAGLYVVDAVFALVLGGRPTPLGLRGLDAVRTITEAGADNQLDPLVEEAMFGVPSAQP